MINHRIYTGTAKSGAFFSLPEAVKTFPNWHLSKYPNLSLLSYYVQGDLTASPVLPPGSHSSQEDRGHCPATVKRINATLHGAAGHRHWEHYQSESFSFRHANASQIYTGALSKPWSFQLPFPKIHTCCLITDRVHLSCWVPSLVPNHLRISFVHKISSWKRRDRWLAKWVTGNFNVKLH